jgi:hypothetical protein
MKKEFLPYYISRAVLSLLFSLLVFGFSWKALLLSIFLFGGFLLYLHSGWFSVDSKNPLFPLRRDSLGLLVQRKALVISIVAGLLTYFSLSYLAGAFDLVLLSGNIAFAVAIIAYFASQFVFFIRA